MPFLPPNQQRQSTEDNHRQIGNVEKNCYISAMAWLLFKKYCNRTNWPVKRPGRYQICIFKNPRWRRAANLKKPSNRDISATANRAIDCDEIWHNDASPLELTLVKISNSLEIQDGGGRHIENLKNRNPTNGLTDLHIVRFDNAERVF